MSSKVHQTVIIDYLKKGFWIQVTRDFYTNEIWRDITDGDNDVMSVRDSTIKSLLRKGLIEERGSWTPCLQIDIVKFKLKGRSLVDRI